MVTQFNRLSSSLRIGRILKHSIHLRQSIASGSPSSTVQEQVKKQTHILCRVQWHQFHSHPNHFGSSAVVCTDIVEVDSPCSYLPLKRIRNRCASGELKVDFGYPLGNETVLVAIPLPFSYNI